MSEPAWLLEKWWYAATTGTGFDIPDGSAFAAGIGDHEITLPLSKQNAALIALAPEMATAILAACDVNDSGDGILSSHPVRGVLDALRDRIEAIGGAG